MMRTKELLKNFFNPKRGLTRIFQNADLRRILFVVRVEGESGWPHLVAGKRYLASGLLVPRVGDWAVFKNPREPERIFVKRVKAMRGREYIMEGAVSWASSSRDFGLVKRRLVLGTLLYGTAD